MFLIKKSVGRNQGTLTLPNVSEVIALPLSGNGVADYLSIPERRHSFQGVALVPMKARQDFEVNMSQNGTGHFSVMV